MAKAEALEKQGPTGLAEFDYGEDIGGGFEHQTKADTQIPFIVLLQALTPMVVEQSRECKAGQFYNTVTEQLWDKDAGFLFVPATTRNFYAEWTPRDDGGGFHGHHEISSALVKETIKNAKEFGKNKLANGNDLVETFYVYGVLCTEEGEGVTMAAMAFSSTKIKPYKGWMTRLRQNLIITPNGKKNPPLFANLVRIQSILTKNNDGNQFYIPKLGAAHHDGIAASLLAPDDQRFQMAKACRMLVDAGDAQIDPNQQKADGAAEAGEDIPF